MVTTIIFIIKWDLLLVNIYQELVLMPNKDYAEVGVREAARDDAGRGIARVSIDVMRTLGLVSGDVIEIQGKKKATAIVWPGFQQDTGNRVIRIDGTVRSNAGAGVDDTVTIRKIELGYAKKIIIAPTQPIRLIGGNSTSTGSFPEDR